MQSATALARTPVPRHEHKAAFRRSWLAGFRMAISERLTEAEERAAAGAGERYRASGHSTGLVLADRSALVDAALHTAYPHTTTARRRSFSGRGGDQGWEAGQRADLGGTRLDGSRRASAEGRSTWRAGAWSRTGR